MDYLSLYRRECKFCKSLDPDEENTYSCHYENGNQLCPARDIQISIDGQSRSYADRVLAARVAGDLETEISVLRAVSKRNQAFRTKFNSWMLK